jgi:hypothetical protein
MNKSHIVALSVVFGLCGLLIMALVTRLFMQKHAKHHAIDESSITDGSNEHQHQHQFARIATSWQRTFSPKQQQIRSQHWVPTLSGLIKAGDEGLFTSHLFNKLHAYPGELSLQALYDLFAEELRSRPATDRATYSVNLSRFSSDTKLVNRSSRRAQSKLHSTTDKALSAHSRPSRTNSGLAAAERGLARTLSVRKPTSALVAGYSGAKEQAKATCVNTSWMEDGQKSELHNGNLGVKITPVELVALAILLGCPLEVRGEGNNKAIHDGAFGISISRVETDFGEYQVTLRQHKYNTSDMPIRGPGVSTLYSKHLAASFLPFAQHSDSVESILVTSHTLTILQAGSPVHLDESNFNTSQTEFLNSLPHSQTLRFHLLSASTEAQTSNPLIDAISTLPFAGGLTPLASIPIIQAAQFIASGGLTAARLLQRLEGLVDKVNKEAPHLNIFGPLYAPRNVALAYRERDRLGRLATDAMTTDSLADKTSRMSRYVTLLERLMALVSGVEPQDVLAAVKEATKKELERSYLEAVATHADKSRPSSVVDAHACADSDARSDRLSITSNEASMRSINSPRSSTVFPSENLSKQVEQILKMELPLSIDTIATVARLVIFAWTLSVEKVAWEEGEEGYRVPSFDELPEKMVMC